MTNPLANVLGNSIVMGNSQIGTHAAAAAAVGASQLKVLSPGDRVGVVGAGAGNWVTPNGGISGEIAVPMEMAPPAYFRITVDTTDETEDTNIVLFDAKNLYATNSCGSCSADKSIGGCVYAGSKTCNTYDNIVNALCSTKYLISSVRVMACNTGSTVDGCGFSEALATKVNIWKGNINFDTQQSSIDLLNHVSPTNYSNNIIDVPLTGQQALLDQWTAWHMNVAPGTKLMFTFFIAAQSI